MRLTRRAICSRDLIDASAGGGGGGDTSPHVYRHGKRKIVIKLKRFRYIYSSYGHTICHRSRVPLGEGLRVTYHSVYHNGEIVPRRSWRFLEARNIEGNRYPSIDLPSALRPFPLAFSLSLSRSRSHSLSSRYMKKNRTGDRRARPG